MGGGKRYVQSLITKLIRKDISVIFLGAQTQLEPDMSASDNLCFLPIVYDDTKWVPFFTRLFTKIPFLYAPHGTVFHIHRTYFALPFLFFKKNAPLVCTLHGLSLSELAIRHPLVKKFVFPLFCIIERFCLKRIDFILPVSQATGELYMKRHPYEWLGRKCKVLPAGVELDLFRPKSKTLMRMKLEISKDIEMVLFVGRLEKCKNIEFILRSFKLVKDRRQNARLFLVGRGSEKSNLLELIQRLGLNGSIHFYGRCIRLKLSF
jgi:glycosyltransferase involved in cell wall biosynthesis